ncbi:hypothetical protein P0L94_00805 [Microbacter sp. GSS18]|nr:hypothetical protein P0L94_00805 [Microbacter sp. GSS18]
MIPKTVGRLAERALWAIADSHSNGTSPELVVLRSCALTEGYVDDLLDQLSAADLHAASDFQELAFGQVRTQLHQSWQSRRQWLKDGFGISIAGSQAAQEFDVLVELRNALTHGAGELTRLQRNRLSDQLALESKLVSVMKLGMRGNRLNLTAETSVAAVKIACSYVIALDSGARAR